MVLFSAEETQKAHVSDYKDPTFEWKFIFYRLVCNFVYGYGFILRRSCRKWEERALDTVDESRQSTVIREQSSFRSAGMMQTHEKRNMVSLNEGI